MSDMLPTFKKENRLLQKGLYLVCMIVGMCFFSLFQLGEHSHGHEETAIEHHEEEIHHENQVEHEEHSEGETERHDKDNENLDHGHDH